MIKLEINISDWAKRMKVVQNRDWPIALAKGFGAIATHARDTVRRHTAIKFRLHSNWITNGVRAIPGTKGQIQAAANSLRKHDDMIAKVYLRGGTDPRKSLSFMVDHEYGDTRDPHNKHNVIALPQRDLLSGYSARTPRGRISARWKPDLLLERFDESGSVFDGKTTRNKGPRSGRNRVPGKPFKVKMGSTTYIARRISKNREEDLEVLYAFKPKAKIKRRWEFKTTVWRDARQQYARQLKKAVNQMPRRR
jgi:hypothetical protein